MMGQMVDAAKEHLEPIALRARQADVEECWTLGALPFWDALTISFLGADYARTWMVNGIPRAMGGIRRHGEDGVIWLLASDFVDRHPRSFLVHSFREFGIVRDQYNLLFNYIDAQNVVFLRWLLWLQFNVSEPVPFGPFRRLAYRFEWRRAG